MKCFNDDFIIYNKIIITLKMEIIQINNFETNKTNKI